MQPVNKNNDINLLHDIAKGDETAFRKLFDAHHSLVYNYLLNVTKSKEISEELLSDIFMKLWLGREWLPQVQNIDAFLKRVSYNKAVDYLRYAARNKKLQEMIAKEMGIFAAHTPEDQLLDKDYQRIVAEAVAMLTPQRKKVFKLSRQEGLSYEEIAQQLNLSVNTVSNHIKSSLQAIKGHLKRNNIGGYYILYFLLG